MLEIKLDQCDPRRRPGYRKPCCWNHTGCHRYPFTDADGQEFTMIDTAGMRKSGKIYENTEKYSVMRAMRAIDRSDVVLMVINAEEGIREYDKRIAGFAHEAGKGMIIVVNKWDTIEKDNHTMKQWEDDISRSIPIPFLCRLFCLCLNQTTLATSCQR